jgi:hypothetical protein
MTLNFSRTGIVSIFLFIALLILYLAIIPFGEEPDFVRRAPEYIAILESIGLSYYSDNIPIVSDCAYVHNPYHVFGRYDFDSCIPNSDLSLKRAFFTFIIYIPLGLIALFYIDKDRLTKTHPFLNGYSFEANSIKLALIFPSFVYYSSLFSKEQITLMLSVLLVFALFKTRYIFAIILLLLIGSLDKGNAIVVFTVSMYVFLSLHVSKKFGFNVFIVINILIIALAYYFSTDILDPLRSISSKVDQILSDIEAYDVSTRYPLWLRPGMTFLSYTFMTPALSKHPLVYALVLAGLVYIYVKYKRSHIPLKVNNLYIVAVIATLSIITIFVFILPGYNNAKYYIFALPIFINTFLQYVSFYRILLFFLILNLIVILDFLLFYIIGCSECQPFPFSSHLFL